MRRAHSLLLTVSLVATACGADRRALTNVTLIDIESGTTVPAAVVVVKANRVLAVGPRDAVDIPRTTTEIDGGGGYVIPGLWDMHVHLTHAGEEALTLMVANGVTGARDMGGDLAIVDRFRARIAAGDLAGPRILRAGRWVDGQKDLTDRYILETPEEGRAAVAEQAAAGVDHIKVHNGLPRAVFFAVADEAKQRGIRLVGHAPMEVWPAEAIDAGLVSVEHIATIFEGKVAGSLTDPRDQLRAIQEYASGGVDTLAKHFVEHNAWFNPTLVAYGVNSRLAELEETPDPRRRYLSPRLEAHWDENFPIAPYELNPRVVAFRKQGDTAFAAVVGKLHQNGVGLLTGTDLGTREIYPGFSVHDELILLVERAGLSPLEALRAATRNPARYLDADSLGVIAAGTLADFVVLEANPLENIRNTSRIRAVAVDGRYYSRDALDTLLLGTERQVADPAVP